MDEVSFHIAFLVSNFNLRLTCVDYDIAIYQPCDVVLCQTQSRGDISMLAVYKKKGG